MKKLVLVAILLLNAPISVYAAQTCAQKLAGRRAGAFDVNNVDAETQAVYNLYQRLNANRELDTLFSHDDLVVFLEDNDTYLYMRAMKTILQEVSESQEPKVTAFKASLKKYLKNRVDNREVDARVAGMTPGRIDTIKRALGSMTLRETQNWLYGGNIENVDPHSQLGKYLAETGARTTVRQFSLKGNENNRGPGPRRLVVTLSQTSLEKFKEHMAVPGWMSVLGHANVLFDGNVFSYGGGKSEFRLPSVNTPLSMAIMTPTEAHRFARYFEIQTKYFANGGWNNALKTPWVIEGYCAKGGYSCCTHWIGNIPIGDRRVEAYTFPSSEGNAGNAPTQVLRNYTAANIPRAQRHQPMVLVNGRWEQPPALPADADLAADIQEIWQAPGHEQFSHVIGQGAGNTYGNFASPGWVIQSLYALTTNERVPVVFLVVQDHTAEIPAAIELNHEHPR